jgi:hypothetical protein
LFSRYRQRNENKKYLNCLKANAITIPFPQRVVTLINKRWKSKFKNISQSTVGKIVSFLIGIALIWMLIKPPQKNLLSQNEGQ